MNDTPRTDAIWPAGMNDHARRIERELATMTAERDRLRADLSLASGQADALREQLRQATTPGWLPIESAPKDGTMFICFVRAERWSQSDGGGSGRGADTSEVDFCQWKDSGGSGYFDNMMGQIGDAQEATHWMPLPQPPQVTK